jgi:predicted dienelactone hydrolase
MNVVMRALGAMIVAAPALVAVPALAATPAFAVGFERVMMPDPEGALIETGIWYPSDAPATTQPLGLFQQTVAPGGPVAGRGLPLIVMSHGTGGSFEGHYDTALALAAAGFVVASVTHTGDNHRDNSQMTHLDNRSRHIKLLIDYMLTAWAGHDAIDAGRIGMFGFSAGGFTTLVAIGGVPDLSLTGAYCEAHPDEWACRTIGPSRTAEMSTPRALKWVHDPRIKAAVAAAPAVGYSFSAAGLAGISVPLQLWRGDSDEILPHPRHAQHIYESLPVKPDYHVVPNAGHFAFLAPCSSALATLVPDICRDPAGFDRTAFHTEFNAAVVAFFKAHLQPRS